MTPRSRRTTLIQLAATLGTGGLMLGCNRSRDASLKIGFLMGAGGLGDQSFNDMTFEGLQQIQQDYGTQVTIIPQELQEITEPAREGALRNLLAQDVRLVVVNGFEYKALMERAAPNHPNTLFLINDVVLDGVPNVAYTSYGQHEGSFLVGALAVLMTQTRKVGVIGGVDIDVVKAFIQGYREGIEYLSSTVDLLEDYVSVAPDYSGFNDPDRGRALALNHYEQGADIIFAVAGLTGNGVIQAAKESGKFAIGVDADQDHLAPGHVLTSMMKRLDKVTYTEVAKVIEGTFTPGGTTYGLKEGGVSLSPMRYTRDQIPDTTLARIEDIQAQIIAGEIKVTNLLK